jgi:2'-5' RNA ligase
MHLTPEDEAKMLTNFAKGSAVEDEEKRRRQRSLGAAEILQGSGELMEPLAVAGALTSPLKVAAGYGAGMLASEGTGSAVHGHVSPEDEELIRSAAFFLPSALGVITGLKTGSVETPRGKFSGGSVFGGKVAAGVAQTAEGTTFRGKVGPFEVSVPPRSAPVIDEATQSMMHYLQGTGEVPKAPPPPPPGPPSLTPEVLDTVARAIAKAPDPMAREALMKEGYWNLTKWILARPMGTFTDPTTGHVETATDLKTAAKLALDMINRQVDTFGKQQTEAATAAAQPPATGSTPQAHPAELHPDHLNDLATKIAAASPAQRPQLILHAHDYLINAIQQSGGRFVGPDGTLHIAKTPEQAEKLAQTLINDAVQGHNKAQEAAAKAADKPATPATKPAAAVQRVIDRGKPKPSTPTPESPAVSDKYEQAKQASAEFGKASTSLLQRRLNIGYAEATHLIDRMEQDGLIKRDAANPSRPPTWIGEPPAKPETAATSATVAQNETDDWMQAKKNLGLPANADYSPAISAEATRIKAERTKGQTGAPQLPNAGDVPAMGRAMTTDSPAVQKVHQEAQLAPGQVPRVEVKDESPADAAKLAQPAKEPSEVAVAKVGDYDHEAGRQIVQPSGSEIENERLAAEAAPELAAGLSEIAASVQGAHFDEAHGGRLRPQKNLERLGEKTEDDKPPNTIGDYLASQIVADTVEAKDQIIAALKQRYNVLGVEDNFLQPRENKAGYASANVQAQMPSGLSAEIQIVIPEIQAITDQTHRLYTSGREFPEGSAERKKYWDEAARFHEAAVQQFRERTGTEEQEFKKGSTQINIAPESALGQAHAAAAASIPDEHLMPTDFGGNPKGREDHPHLTLRYGLKDDSPAAVEKIKEAASKIAPFEVPIGPTDTFPASEHSDGAVPVIAPLESTPELLALRKAVEGAGSFHKDTFDSYRPHLTIGYVKPEVAAQYKGGRQLEGQNVPVDHIVVSKKDGSQETIPLGGTISTGLSTDAGQAQTRTPETPGQGQGSGSTGQGVGAAEPVRAAQKAQEKRSPARIPADSEEGVKLEALRAAERDLIAGRKKIPGHEAVLLHQIRQEIGEIVDRATGAIAKPAPSAKSPEVPTFKRDNPPQVAQPLVLKRGVEFTNPLHGGEKLHLKGTEYLLPGFEEYRIAVVPPRGSIAKHDKQGWSSYEITTGARLFTEIHQHSTEQRTLDGTIKLLQQNGKQKFDAKIKQFLGAAATDTWADGRMKSKDGDEVYQAVPGFGGSIAYINGKVETNRKGELRVRVTGSASLIGSTSSVGKTYPADQNWTVKNDPEIKRREEAKKAAEKQRADDAEKEASERKAELQAEWDKNGKLKAMDVGVGDVLETINTGYGDKRQRFVVNQIVGGGQDGLELYGVDENDLSATPGYLGDSMFMQKIGHREDVKEWKAQEEEKAPEPQAAATTKPSQPGPGSREYEDLKKRLAEIEAKRDAKLLKLPPQSRGGPKLDAQQISDFDPSRDKVIRRDGRTFVIDTKGERAPTEVKSDLITDQWRVNFDKMTPEQRVKMTQVVRNTPYLSAEGKAERLAILEGAPATPAAAPAKKTPPAKTSPNYLSDEELPRFFKPGRIVNGYGGQRDEVIAFHPPEPGANWPKNGWNVDVAAVDKDGNRIKGERVRNHATMPDKQEIAKFRADEAPDLPKGWTVTEYSAGKSGKLWQVNDQDGYSISRMNESREKAIADAQRKINSFQIETDATNKWMDDRSQANKKETSSEGSQWLSGIGSGYDDKWYQEQLKHVLQPTFEKRGKNQGGRIPTLDEMKKAYSEYLDKPDHEPLTFQDFGENIAANTGPGYWLNKAAETATPPGPQQSFKVGVKGKGDANWAYNALRFPTEEAAKAWGQDLWSRWSGVDQWEVHPSDEAPNREAEAKPLTAPEVHELKQATKAEPKFTIKKADVVPTEEGSYEARPQTRVSEPAEIREASDQTLAERVTQLEKALEANKTTGGTYGGATPALNKQLQKIRDEQIRRKGYAAQPLPGYEPQPPGPLTYRIGDLVEYRGKQYEVGFEQGNRVRLQDPKTHERIEGWALKSEVTPVDKEPEATPAAKLADAVYKKLITGESLGNMPQFERLAAEHFGSSRVSGEWTPKDATDAMEAGVNKYLLDAGENLMGMPAIEGLAMLRENLMNRLPTQSTRTDEQLKGQQFSTPPTEAYTVAKVAGIKPDDVVLEPSGGNGGLAIFAKAVGAEVHVNEISTRRQAMLKHVGFDNITSHDGEIINSLLKSSVQPTVIIMNPPFSAGALKGAEGQAVKNRNVYGFNHVDSALQRLAPGGRLVTILGGGRADDANGGAALTAPGGAGRWFDKIAEKYNVRANIRIAGKEYAKYGTSFATRIIVIDKDGSTPSRMGSLGRKRITDEIQELQGKPSWRLAYLKREANRGDLKNWDSTVQGNVSTLEQAYTLLENVAETRPVPTRTARTAGTGQEIAATGVGESKAPGTAGSGQPLRGERGTGAEIQPTGGPERVPGQPGGVAAGVGNQPVPLQQSQVQPATGPRTPVQTAGGAGGSTPAVNAERPSTVSAAEKLREQIRKAAGERLGKKIEGQPQPGSPEYEALKQKLAQLEAKKPRAIQPATPKPKPAERFTADNREEALKRLRARRGEVQPEGEEPPAYSLEEGGEKELTPEDINDMVDVGGFHFQQGIIQFDPWSKKMIADLGEWARPYLEVVHQEVSSLLGKPIEGKPKAPPATEAEKQGLQLEREAREQQAETEDTSAFVSYRPTLKGSTHPGPIVESKSMATVSLPEITYQPRLPQSVVTEGRISAVQMEPIALAGQQNQIILPSGHRAAAASSDGTGVGKGREAAGVLFDNWRQGRRRLVWVSEKWDLMQDAIRDLDGIGATTLSKTIKPFMKQPATTPIDHEGIMFSTYALLRSEDKKGNKRIAQLEKWIRGNDEGEGAHVIFDECVPAGTKIETPSGPVPIEQLHIGDSVWGFNHDTGEIEATPVLYLFRRETVNDFTIVHETPMTGNHPVWTANRGYVPSDELACDDTVALLDFVPDALQPHLCFVPAAICSEAEYYSQYQGDDKTSFLYEEVLGTVADEQSGIESQKAYNSRRKAEVVCNSSRSPQAPGRSRENAAASLRPNESITQSSSQGRSARSFTQERIRSSQWRERNAAVLAAANAGREAGVANGVRGNDQHTSRDWTADSLQTGYFATVTEVSDRGGRRGTPSDKGETGRSAQRGVPPICRLDCNEIQEPGDTGFPGNRRVCRTVHNIETATRNYFAGGLLVHNCQALKNAVARSQQEVSLTGDTVKKFLERNPKLRTFFLSATPATDVTNLGYMDRLGIWGAGTPFPGGFEEFNAKISAGGMSAMEMIARELKSQGKYVSRTLSYKGVQYSEIEHTVNDEQKDLYRSAVKAWKLVSQRVEDTIQNTVNGGSRAKSRFMSLFYASQQRFFNVLLTTLKIPTAVEQANKALGDGKSVVISLVNTNEAAQNREKLKFKGLEDTDEIPDYDFGPAEMLMDLVQEHYPTQQWIDDVDSEGKPIKVLATQKDESGRDIPVVNPQAVAERDALIKELKQNLQMPANPLDILVESLGGHSKVAEITGRKERFDPTTSKFVSRGDPGVARDKINKVEEGNFNAGKKRVAILSTAGGTGISLHAGKDMKNQQKRLHITLQVGWSADRAMQMLGRTHRSNQVQPPEYALLKTNMGGESRFISTIARRLGSLEALSKGQTKTNEGTEMMDKVNFETDQGKAATRAFYQSLLKNTEVPETATKESKGKNLTGMQILEDLKVLKTGQGGAPTVPDADMVNVTRLLNRLLALDPDVQNGAYNYFYDIFEAAVKDAIENGTLDTGVKQMPGDTFTVKEQRVIARDPKTGAETFYYPVDADVRTERLSVAQLEKKMKQDSKLNPRILRNGDGKLAFVVDAKDIIRADGHREPASYVVYPDYGKWEKVANHKLEIGKWGHGADQKPAYIPGFEEISEWSKKTIDKAKSSVQSAEWSLKSTKESRERYPQYYTEESIKEKEEALERAQKSLADSEAATKDPIAWGKEEWGKQYEAAPAHNTTPNHLIGGAVMHWWNAIHDSTQRLEVYTVVDSKSGQRVVGVAIPKEQIAQLLAKITGNKSAVNSSQIIKDVLENNTPYRLEGGTRIVRGRVGRDRVVQFIPSGHGMGEQLKSMGVVYEKGLQPIYYLPMSGTERFNAANILDKVLKTYPAEVETKGGEEEEPAYSLQSPSGWESTGENAPEVTEIKAVYRPSVGSIPPTVELSSAAFDMARSAIGAPHGIVGANLSVTQAARTAQNLRNFAPMATDAKVRQDMESLASAFDQAAKSPQAKTKGVNFFTGARDEHIFQEEVFHGGVQRELGAGKIAEHLPEDAYPRLLNHPVAKKLLGTALKHSYYQAYPDYMKVAEMAAKIAADENTLSPEDAADWFTEYYNELERHHGPAKIAEIMNGMFDRAKELHELSIVRLQTNRAALSVRPGEGTRGLTAAGEGSAAGPTGIAPPGNRGRDQENAGGEGQKPTVEPPAYSLKEDERKGERGFANLNVPAVLSHATPVIERGAGALVRPLVEAIAKAAAPVRDLIQSHVLPSKWQARAERKENLAKSRNLETNLLDLDRKFEGSAITAAKTLQEVGKDTTVADRLAVDRHIDSLLVPQAGPTSLSPEQQRILDQYVTPLREANQALYEELREANIPADFDPTYLHRVVRDRQNQLQRATEGSRGSGRGNVLSKTAASLKQRVMYSLDDGEGTRRVVSFKDGQVTGWDGGQPTPMSGEAPSGFTVGKRFIDDNRGEWSITQATKDEIEENTGLTYFRDPVATTMADFLQLTRAVEAKRFLDAWKSSPAFASVAMLPEKGLYAPRGWKEIANLPQFRGYQFEPRTAEVLQRFADKLNKENAPSILGKLADVAQTSILLNPLLHVLNMADFAVVSRGAVANANVLGLGNVTSTMAKAIKSAVTKDADYIRALDAGAHLMSHKQYVSDLNKHFVELMTGMMENNKPFKEKMRDYMGLRQGDDPVQAIRRASHAAAFVSNDILYMQSVHEKIADGMSMEAAVRETNKIFPDYQVPTRPLDSKLLGDIMRTRWLTWFNGYHLGRFKAYKNIFEGAFKSGVDDQARGHALSMLAMLGLLVAVGYGAYDQFMKKVTNEPNAKSPRFGLSKLPAEMIETAKGERSFSSLAQSQFTPSTLIRAAHDVIENRDYKNDFVYNPEGSAVTKAKQIGEHMGKSSIGPLMQYEQYERDTEPGAGKREALRLLLGTKFPKSESMSPAEILMHRFAGQAMPPRTPEEQQEYTDNKARIASGHLTQADVKKILFKMRTNEFKRMLPRFTLGQIKKVMAESTPAERVVIMPIYIQKEIQTLKDPVKRSEALRDGVFQ